MRAPLVRLLLPLLLACAAASPLRAEEPRRDAAAFPPPLLPGIGNQDPRTRIDPGSGPWRAVGKLQANAGGMHMSCTGTLVAPDVVLTAAHCVFNLRTGQSFPPGSLHFLIGFEGGSFAAHAGVRRFVTGAGYDHTRRRETFGSDWALLTLDAKIGTKDRILHLSEHAPEVGSMIMIGGYSQDHALVLTADSSCRIVGRLADGSGHALLRHNCTATSGVSGAPVLVKDGGEWRVAGIVAGGEKGIAGGIAATVDEVRGRL
jgi:protease YdgD